ncbi:unnamed protein product, partial [Didymodactylos carnosus]
MRRTYFVCRNAYSCQNSHSLRANMHQHILGNLVNLDLELLSKAFQFYSQHKYQTKPRPQSSRFFAVTQPSRMLKHQTVMSSNIRPLLTPSLEQQSVITTTEVEPLANSWRKQTTLPSNGNTMYRTQQSQLAARAHVSAIPPSISRSDSFIRSSPEPQDSSSVNTTSTSVPIGIQIFWLMPNCDAHIIDLLFSNQSKCSGGPIEEQTIYKHLGVASVVYKNHLTAVEVVTHGPVTFHDFVFHTRLLKRTLDTRVIYFSNLPQDEEERLKLYINAVSPLENSLEIKFYDSKITADNYVGALVQFENDIDFNQIVKNIENRPRCHNRLVKYRQLYKPETLLVEYDDEKSADDVKTLFLNDHRIFHIKIHECCAFVHFFSNDDVKKWLSYPFPAHIRLQIIYIDIYTQKEFNDYLQKHLEEIKIKPKQIYVHNIQLPEKIEQKSVLIETKTKQECLSKEQIEVCNTEVPKTPSPPQLVAPPPLISNSKQQLKTAVKSNDEKLTSQLLTQTKAKIISDQKNTVLNTNSASLLQKQKSVVQMSSATKSEKMLPDTKQHSELITKPSLSKQQKPTEPVVKKENDNISKKASTIPSTKIIPKKENDTVVNDKQMSTKSTLQSSIEKKQDIKTLQPMQSAINNQIKNVTVQKSVETKTKHLPLTTSTVKEKENIDSSATKQTHIDSKDSDIEKEDEANTTSGGDDNMSSNESLDETNDNNDEIEWQKCLYKNLMSANSEMQQNGGGDENHLEAPYTFLYGDDYCISMKNRKFANAFIDCFHHCMENSVNPERMNKSLIKFRTTTVTPKNPPVVVQQERIQKQEKKKRRKRNRKQNKNQQQTVTDKHSEVENYDNDEDDPTNNISEHENHLPNMPRVVLTDDLKPVTLVDHDDLQDLDDDTNQAEWQNVGSKKRKDIKLPSQQQRRQKGSARKRKTRPIQTLEQQQKMKKTMNGNGTSHPTDLIIDKKDIVQSKKTEQTHQLSMTNIQQQSKLSSLSSSTAPPNTSLEQQLISPPVSHATTIYIDNCRVRGFFHQKSFESFKTQLRQVFQINSIHFSKTAYTITIDGQKLFVEKCLHFLEKIGAYLRTMSVLHDNLPKTGFNSIVKTSTITHQIPYLFDKNADYDRLFSSCSRLIDWQLKQHYAQQLCIYCRSKAKQLIISYLEIPDNQQQNSILGEAIKQKVTLLLKQFIYIPIYVPNELQCTKRWQLFFKIHLYDQSSLNKH